MCAIKSINNEIKINVVIHYKIINSIAIFKYTGYSKHFASI